MITIPDAITKFRMILKKIIDKPLSWMESFGSWMNVYAWNKRWRNREQGTGYAKKPSSEVFTPSPREDDTE